jgi:hypothetical protein
MMCGIPCSGKTRRAAMLQEQYAARGRTVCVVNEEALGLCRAVCYKDATAEKNTRGAIKSLVDRSLAKDVVVRCCCAPPPPRRRPAAGHLRLNELCQGIPLRAVLQRARSG